MKNEAILGILWTGYGIIHSLLASEAVKKIFFTKYYRLIYNMLAIILLLPILYFQLTADSKRLMEDSIFNQLLGGIMMSSGIFMMYTSMKGYASREFLGLDFDKKEEPFLLKTDGLSAFIRHPLYTGTLLLFWGLFGFFATETYMTTAIFITLYVRIGIYFEEKKLVNVYGKQYEEYRKNVPMLIPRI
jgi:hypothetical protein